MKGRTFAQILADKFDLFGVKIEGKSAQVAKMATRVNRQNRYEIVLRDCSADIKGTVSPADAANLRENMVVIIDFVVMNCAGDNVELKISSIREAKDNEVSRADLDREALSQKVIESCKETITSTVGLVNSEGYKQLLQACITDETLDKLLKLPASLDRQGKYLGGALVQTATVVTLIYYMMGTLAKFENKLYSRGYAKDALYTAGLLHLYGTIDFYKEHNGKMRKTQKGLSNGYFVTLERALLDIVMKKNIPITEVELSTLFNILGSADRKLRGLRAVSKEGELLCNAINTFERLDIFDAEYWRLSELNLKLDLEEREEYGYSDILECQIFVQCMTPEEKEKAEQKKKGEGN